MPPFFLRFLATPRAATSLRSMKFGGSSSRAARPISSRASASAPPDSGSPLRGAHEESSVASHWIGRRDHGLCGPGRCAEETPGNGSPGRGEWLLGRRGPLSLRERGRLYGRLPTRLESTVRGRLLHFRVSASSAVFLPAFRALRLKLQARGRQQPASLGRFGITPDALSGASPFSRVFPCLTDRREPLP